MRVASSVRVRGGVRIASSVRVREGVRVKLVHPQNRRIEYCRNILYLAFCTPKRGSTLFKTTYRINSSEW